MQIALVVAALLLILIGPLNLILVLVLRRDLAELRRRMDAIPPEARTPAEAARVAPRLVADPADAALRPVTFPRPRVDLEAALGGAWLTWLGIVAIFFGTAFFLAIDLDGHPLAGVGQVMVGLVVGALFVVAGRTVVVRIGRILARGLLGGGIALLFLTAYASHAFHHLVPAAVVYPFLLGVAVVGAAVALVEESQAVAVLTATCALLTPFFMTGRAGAPGPLFAYLALVNTGSIILTSRRRWRLIEFISFFGTVILVVWWWARAYTPDARPVAAAGISALWLLFGAPPLLRGSADTRRSDGAARAGVLAANGILCETALYRLLGSDYAAIRGVMSALLALIYVSAAEWAAQRTMSQGARPGPAVRMTRHTGLALAALAIPTQFDLQWVTLGWALLALVMLHAGLSDGGGERLIGWFVLLLALVRAFIVDVIVTLRASGTQGYHAISSGPFLVGLATVAALAAAAHFVARNRERLTAFERPLATPLVITAAILFLWRLSFEDLAWFRSRAGASGSDLHRPMLLSLSILWALYAGLLIASGFMRRYRPLRVLGIMILVVLLAKVFWLDTRELERGYRIASFVGVGLLLLGISILYQRERKTR